LEEAMDLPTVLVAEADPSIRKLFEDILCSAGYQVQLTEQGALSASQVVAARPDLLLLELMPGSARQTLALIEATQRQPETVALPVLVTTTIPLLAEQHRAALHRLGCGTLLKPFDLDELLGMVRQQVVPSVYRPAC
jgi:DNA-binding response OmpR family regulator